MATPMHFLLAGPRAAAHAFSDLSRIADAAARTGTAVATLAGDVTVVASSIVQISDEIAGIRREVEAARHSIDRLQTEVWGIRASIEVFPDATARIVEDADRHIEELHGLRHEIRPLVGKIDDTSSAIAGLGGEIAEVAEPLRPAAERIGKVARRLPGKTKPD
jgi:methyl-accepting chemotaxis protein